MTFQVSIVYREAPYNSKELEMACLLIQTPELRQFVNNIINMKTSNHLVFRSHPESSGAELATFIKTIRKLKC